MTVLIALIHGSSVAAAAAVIGSLDEKHRVTYEGTLSLLVSSVPRTKMLN